MARSWTAGQAGSPDLCQYGPFEAFLVIFDPFLESVLKGFCTIKGLKSEPEDRIRRWNQLWVHFGGTFEGVMLTILGCPRSSHFMVHFWPFLLVLTLFGHFCRNSQFLSLFLITFFNYFFKKVYFVFFWVFPKQAIFSNPWPETFSNKIIYFFQKVFCCSKKG